MDRDSITRTGARAPGVEQPGCSHGGAPAYRVPRLRTRTQRYRQRGARRTDANRTTRRTRARREGPSDTPALKPEQGKPALRNFRGDHGDVGIIRSPVRAMVLPGGEQNGPWWT